MVFTWADQIIHRRWWWACWFVHALDEVCEWPVACVAVWIFRGQSTNNSTQLQTCWDLGLLDEDDLPDYTTTDESDMDKAVASAPSKLLVSNVYTDLQTEEETELVDTGIALMMWLFQILTDL